MPGIEFFVLTSNQRSIAIDLDGASNFQIAPSPLNNFNPGTGTNLNDQATGYSLGQAVSLIGCFVTPKRIIDDPAYQQHRPNLVAWLVANCPVCLLNTEWIFAPLRSTEAGAAVVDLRQGRAWDGSASVALSSLLSVSRATSGTAELKDGTVVTFAAHEPRMTDRGMLKEASRAQSITAPVTPASWALVGATVSALPADGVFNPVAVSGSQNFHRIQAAQITSGLNGIPVYFKVRCKVGTSGRIRIACRNATKGTETDLVGPIESVSTAGATAGTITNIGIRYLPNGLREVHGIFTANDTGNIQFAVGPDGAGTVISYGMNIFINQTTDASWQLSAGTRDADVVTLLGAAAGKTTQAVLTAKGTRAAITSDTVSATGYLSRIAAWSGSKTSTELDAWAGILPWLSGVNLAGGQFTSAPAWPTNAASDYYIGKGMKCFRIPYLWERMQPTLGSAFDSTQFGEMDRLVQHVTGAGCYAVIDCHNHFRYSGNVVGDVGSPVTAAHFVDLWTRFATIYRSNSLVIFNLMNEPHDMTDWLNISNQNAAIAGIRSAGSENFILASGNAFGTAWSWYYADNGGTMRGIVDPMDYYAFDAHQYLDSDEAGQSTTCVVGNGAHLARFTMWGQFEDQRGWVGETHMADNAQCVTEIGSLLSAASSARDVWMGWSWFTAGGKWNAANAFSLDPTDFSSPIDRPQMAYVAPYIT